MFQTVALAKSGLLALGIAVFLEWITGEKVIFPFFIGFGVVLCSRILWEYKKEREVKA